MIIAIKFMHHNSAIMARREELPLVAHSHLYHARRMQ